MKPVKKSARDKAMPQAAPPLKLRKRDPKALDKMLDKAIEDSMAASDPPTVAREDFKP